MCSTSCRYYPQICLLPSSDRRDGVRSLSCSPYWKCVAARFEESVGASVSVCEARSVKEFIVCSPPVIILVPINLLASLEPVAIWKHCSVYKLGKDQHSGALTSHTNLETIRARQSGWLLRKGPAWIPLTGCGDARPLVRENANSVLRRKTPALLSHRHLHFQDYGAFFIWRLYFCILWPFFFFFCSHRRTHTHNHPPTHTNKHNLLICFFALFHGMAPTSLFFFFFLFKETGSHNLSPHVDSRLWKATD